MVRVYKVVLLVGCTSLMSPVIADDDYDGSEYKTAPRVIKTAPQARQIDKPAAQPKQKTLTVTPASDKLAASTVKTTKAKRSHWQYIEAFE